MNDKLKKEIDKLVKEWIEDFTMFKCDEFGIDVYKEFEKQLLSLIQREVPRGVCKNCWNKGYSTEMIGGTIASADFFGDKEHRSGPKITINFCKCDKGKQLKELIQREKEELLEEIKLEEKRKPEDLKHKINLITHTTKRGIREEYIYALLDGYNQAIEDLEKIKSNLLKGRNKQKD